MISQLKTGRHEAKRKRTGALTRVHLWIILISILTTGCSTLQAPKVEPFYAQTAPPRKQEFRWSNGKMPKSFDPALASASPEADFARALYEGLTDTDSKTLQAVPAIAVKWSASEDFKTWTFQLRKDAKWSTGEAITAHDFVRSWKRLVELGEKIPQRGMLKNIVGMDTENVLPVFANEEIDVLSKGFTTENLLEARKPEVDADLPREKTEITVPAVKTEKNTEKEPKKKAPFGVEAVNDSTLKVSLVQPDENFSALVAHPIFRPVYGSGKEFEGEGLNADIVTSGAFRISSVAGDGLILDRSENYWNAGATELERVRFVPTESAEHALEGYRAGEIDAVTNADFKPLALKLLTPFDDFRRTTHGALNFYEFNQNNPLFADARVRRALAIAIERERLTEDEMDGASRPALGFSPFTNQETLSQNIVEAQKLFSDAGYADGRDFPSIRLLINRNDMQKRIARAVAKMWKKNLGVETEIVVKDTADFEAAFKNGEFDIVRRGVVLPTTDETANMLAMFPAGSESDKENSDENRKEKEVSSDNDILNEKSAESNLNLAEREGAAQEQKPNTDASADARGLLLTEHQALAALPAIPLYFPTTYSLVKPYVQGFETNALDAPSLKNVKINNDWQPSNQKFVSKDQN